MLISPLQVQNLTQNSNPGKHKTLLRISNLLFLIVFCVLIFSCFQSSKKDEPLSREEQQNLKEEEEKQSYEDADFALEFESEKIVLLSVVKNVSPELAYSVLRDYEVKKGASSGRTFMETIRPSIEFLSKIIDTVALKNNLSKQKTASIIFSFQYELLTKEDIIDEWQESWHEEQRINEEYSGDNYRYY